MAITVSSAAVSIMLSIAPPEMTNDQFEQAYCMAVNNYHEARGDGMYAMKHVSSVVVNLSNQIGMDFCDVIMKPEMFSWTNDEMEINHYDPAEMAAFREGAHVAVNYVMGISQPVTDATHYYNPRKANPSWAKKMTVVAEYGGHVFLKEK